MEAYYMFSEETINTLKEPIQSHIIDNNNYLYVKVSDVIDKLNKAFEYKWSSKIVSMERYDNCIICNVEISVGSGDNLVVKNGIGGKDCRVYSKGPKAGKIIDLSADYSSALSSALKQAAKQFGIRPNEENKSSKTNRKSYNQSYNRPSNTPTQPYNKPATSFNKPAVATTGRIQSTTPNVSNLPRPGGPVSSQVTIKTPNSIPTQFVSNNPNNGILSSVQLSALHSQSIKVSMSASELIAASPVENNKTSFEELTRSEAVKVLKHINTALTTNN
jgi:hypothetical protein